VILAASGCADTDRSTQQLRVLAAASLTEPFGELAERFEAQHEGVDVVTGFDSSATLAVQVTEGAPADVVATADPRTMESMVRAGALDGSPVVFARNQLTLVVPADNPAGIANLADLERAEFVVCAATAPCGALAADVLERARVATPPRSYEVDVKAVLTKVMLGEADAGLVYASDVVAAGDRVREIALPAASRPTTEYPVAVTADSARPRLARAFVDLVRSTEGQRVLARSGFRARGASR
jgi:molybdate transport system substrate-binding protein